MEWTIPMIGIAKIMSGMRSFTRLRGSGVDQSPERIALTPLAVPNPSAAPAIRAVPPPTNRQQRDDRGADHEDGRPGHPGRQRVTDGVDEAEAVADVFPRETEQVEADDGGDGQGDEIPRCSEHAALLRG